MGRCSDLGCNSLTRDRETRCECRDKVACQVERAMGAMSQEQNKVGVEESRRWRTSWFFTNLSNRQAGLVELDAKGWTRMVSLSVDSCDLGDDSQEKLKIKERKTTT